MEELNKIISGLYSKIDNQEKIIRELQEENQELKNDCEDLFQQKQSMFENMLLNQEKTLNCIKTIKELKERIDKAIEIIESYNLGKYDYSIPPGGIIDLLEILKGDSE